MKLQFSLATLLVCMTVLAVVYAVAAALPRSQEQIRVTIEQVTATTEGGSGS